MDTMPKLDNYALPDLATPTGLVGGPFPELNTQSLQRLRVRATRNSTQRDSTWRLHKSNKGEGSRRVSSGSVPTRQARPDGAERRRRTSAVGHTDRDLNP